MKIIWSQYRKTYLVGDTWVAPLVKLSTLDFGLAHDDRVMRLSHTRLCAGLGACLRFSLFLCPSPTPPKEKDIGWNQM